MEKAMMYVNPSYVSYALVLSVKGRVDATNSYEFLNEVNNRMTLTFPGTPVIMDLEKPNYASSAGLRVLLALAQSLKSAGRPMVLHSLCGPVEDALRISRFNEFINIAHDLDHALSMVPDRRH